MLCSMQTCDNDLGRSYVVKDNVQEQEPRGWALIHAMPLLKGIIAHKAP